jgi:hypothetical protein
MNPDRKEPPTLESLLRLKRAETPGPEFWTRFETELRERQLAAIVEKRPWWCAFPKVYVFGLRHNRQIGSVAALAVASFLGYHEFHAFAANAPRSAGVQVAYAAQSMAQSAPRAAIPVARQAPAVVTTRAAAVVAAAPASQDSHGGLALAIGPVDDTPVVPSARLIAATLAAARMNGPVGGSFAGFQTGFETQASSINSQMDEPLANMTTPSEERRSRLMASAVPAMATSGGFSERVSERLASRLSDDRLYESMSRYGVGATAVSIKF